MNREKQMHEQGFKDLGVEKFVETVCSVFPHLPGNFKFISNSDKIDFFCKNKEYIYELLEKAKPDIDHDSYDETFLTRFSLSQVIIDRFHALQSASSTLTGL